MSEEELLEYILKNFSYENGIIIRHDRKNSNGSYDKDGYLILKIKGKQLKAHRVVFALCNGRFPDGEVDHINGIRDDNRIENLRECRRIDNVLNRKIPVNGKTKVIGVYEDKTPGLNKKFAFHFQGKTYRYYSAQDAVAEKEKLRKAAYGEYFCR